MASMRKRVQCFADFPFAQYPNARVPWDDVYLRWKGKPGRRVYRGAPCLECEAEVHADLKIHEDIRNREDDEELNALDPIFRPARTTTKAERQTWYRDEDATYQQVLKDLETQEFACHGEGAGLHIYTKAQGINKREAERMLAWWLERTHGIRNPKFVWNRPKFWVTPVGFGEYRD
jgi:hypothetical protein